MNLTTTQASLLAGVDPRSFARWARSHGIAPIGRERIGRSWVTWWSLDALTSVKLDAEPPAC